MLHNIQIDDTNPNAKAFLEFIKTLDFVRIEKSDLSIWQKGQLDQALEEHNNSSTNYTSWAEVRKNLFNKYDIK